MKLVSRIYLLVRLIAKCEQGLRFPLSRQTSPKFCLEVRYNPCKREGQTWSRNVEVRKSRTWRHWRRKLLMPYGQLWRSIVCTKVTSNYVPYPVFVQLYNVLIDIIVDLVTIILIVMSHVWPTVFFWELLFRVYRPGLLMWTKKCRNCGCVGTQVSMCWLQFAETWAEPLVYPCGICVGRSDTGASFYPTSSVSLC
jgi:hypothetical protein